MGLKDTKAAFFEKMAGYTSDPDRELEFSIFGIYLMAETPEISLDIIFMVRNSTWTTISIRELRSPVLNIYTPFHELVSACKPSPILDHIGLCYIQKASSGHCDTRRPSTPCNHRDEVKQYLVYVHNLIFA